MLGQVFRCVPMYVCSFTMYVVRSGLATVPHNAKIHYNYANYLRDTGRGDEAAHHYSLAIRFTTIVPTVEPSVE